jgi:hypothetical protein
MAPHLQNGSKIDFYGANARLSIDLLDWHFSPAEQCYFVRSNGSLTGPGLAVMRGWKVSVPAALDISTDDPVYSQMVSEWLQQQGISPAKLNITRILRVDLEGDGIDEVLVNATYYASTAMPVTQAGDYSVLLLRKVSGKDVVTIPIVAEYYAVNATAATYPNTFSLDQVLDLNLDGRMEIIVGIHHWEGLGVAIFQFADNQPVEVLTLDC